MKRLIQLTDRSVIADWLRRDVAMNIFGLCDLDRGEWSRTKWMALEDEGELLSLLLIYSTDKNPLVLLHGRFAEALILIEISRTVLPRKFYLSVAMPLDRELQIAGAQIEVHADYLRMVPSARTAKEHMCRELVSLRPSDANRIRNLLFESRAYPNAWLNEQTLRSGLYRGWVENEKLLGIVGIHAASEEYGVAVIGNLAVHPDARGRGIGAILMEAVTSELTERGWQSAFNVLPDNANAIDVYMRTGCQVVGTIKEFEVTLD